MQDGRRINGKERWINMDHGCVGMLDKYDDGRTDGQSDGWSNSWTTGWMERLVDEQIDKVIDEQPPWWIDVR